MSSAKIIKLLVTLILILSPSYLSITAGTCAEAEGDSSLVQVRPPEEIIDPHFTGKDCDVCHEVAPEPGDKDLQLKYGGDDVAMCNSCHQTEYVKGDLHPVNMVPVESDSFHIPDEFPLYREKLTCRTCHDVYMQCQANPSVQFKNINFLRGAPYKKTTDICFNCHNIEVYKKTNPHEQLDETGTILKEQCLYCHQSLPDPNAVAGIEDVTFKTETSSFCAACHGEEETLHPARVNHVVTPPQKMLSSIEAFEKKFEITLPLFEGDVFCGTCHNPHDKGVIKREEANKGSEAEHRLRLNGVYDLCIACHSEKEDLFTREITIDIQDKDLSLTARGEGIPSYHKSFVEKKCRACHIITRESPERPIVYKMCFQTDCHDASLVEETFKHGEALTGNCLLCHSQHGSQYGAHIVSDQQKLCKACHPLLRGMEENGKKDEEGEDFHDYYLALFQKLVPDQEATCSFCHGEDHSERIHENGIVSCYQCHNYTKELIKGEKGKPQNIHETFIRFIRNKCTLCHNPHSSPYPHLLKKEPETYE